jgi:hypothetical protein
VEQHEHAAISIAVHVTYLLQNLFGFDVL